MHGHDCPTVGGWASDVVDLPFGQSAIRGMDHRECSHILLFSATRKCVDDGVRHDFPLRSSWSASRLVYAKPIRSNTGHVTRNVLAPHPATAFGAASPPQAAESCVPAIEAAGRPE